MDFSERLKEERKRLGLNQTDFGKIAGVGKTTQINYESGERSPDADYLATVAAAGVDVLFVLTGQRMSVAANASALTHLGEPDWNLIEALLEGIEAALTAKRKRLPPRKKAELVKVLYQHYTEQKQATTPGFDQFMEAVLAAI